MLKLAVLRHKARLSAEFTRCRIRRGHATLDALRHAVEDGHLAEGDAPVNKAYKHPRWVRVNTLRTSLAEQLATTFAGYDQASHVEQIQQAPATARIYFEDPHIPNLLAFPPKIDLTKSPAYANGAIIFQDKASCFPAYLLDVGPQDGDAIDGCAAPGNKTTHLAAIMSERKTPSSTQMVFAYEKDASRAVTLQKMVKSASAHSITTVKAGADFLKADPDGEEFANVGAILLDPSCSGSGIVGRDDAIKMHLPTPAAGISTTAPGKKDKKRKRDHQGANSATDSSTILSLGLDDSIPEEVPIENNLSERLAALATFQLRILTHAMHFPKARKITYSTCSVHFEENEGVVFQALASPVAKERGWRIMPREHQVQGLRDWQRRGVWEDKQVDGQANVTDQLREEICNACIRCEKGTREGTMGFFVAGFVRDSEAVHDSAATSDSAVEDLKGEWNGFGDEDELGGGGVRSDVDEADETSPVQPVPSVSPQQSKKRRKKTNRIR